MRCVIFGGAGFIGSHCADALVERGHEVRIFDRPHVSLENLRDAMDRIEIMEGDFNNAADIDHCLGGMEVIIHLVSTTLPGPSNENPAYDVESNVIGTIAMLERAMRKGIRKVVFASSGGTVYGIPRVLPIPETHETQPICSYGITKLVVEKYLSLFHHLYGLEHVVLRLGNPYGERQRTDAVQGALAVFLGKILRHEPITIWGDGSVARDYFYIGDLVSAFVHAVEGTTPSHVYNIGSGQATSLMTVLSTIEKVTGEKPAINFTPARKLDVPVNCLDISRAKKELSWAPRIGLEDGIGRTWEWLQRFHS